MAVVLQCECEADRNSINIPKSVKLILRSAVYGLLHLTGNSW